MSSWCTIFCACFYLSDHIFVQNTFNGTPVQIPHLCNILSKYSTKDVRGPHIFAKSPGSWGKDTALYLFGCFDKIFESIKFAFILNICQKHQKNSVMWNMKIIHFWWGIVDYSEKLWFCLKNPAVFCGEWNQSQKSCLWRKIPNMKYMWCIWDAGKFACVLCFLLDLGNFNKLASLEAGLVWNYDS